MTEKRTDSKMKQWILRAVFGILAAVMAAAAVFAAAAYRGKTPVLLYAPEEASARVVEMMEAVCAGDFYTAAGMMYGRPDLGVYQEPEDAVNRAFWRAFVSSLDYELVGDLYATETGMAQDVKIISLELDTATEKLGQRAKALLQQGVEQAADASDIYDATNGYKESFVEDVIAQASREALEEDVRYAYQTVTLQLVYSNDQWRIIPNRELLNAISGGTAG